MSKTSKDKYTKPKLGKSARKQTLGLGSVSDASKKGINTGKETYSEEELLEFAQGLNAIYSKPRGKIW